MGDPKRRRKKFHSPGHPYQKARLESELVLVGKYGLRNKRELWRARTKLGNYRKQARSFLALEGEEKTVKEEVLLKNLQRLGIVGDETEADDILGLELENILRRRLQTRVLERGLAGSIHQARQLITHRHIMINGRIMTSPGYIVPLSMDEQIEYSPNSPFNAEDHPMSASLTRGAAILEIPKVDPRKGRGARK
ncbi:MAG: 30S ribosomal protein S4 [Candidatus Kariarchaeaceae archaeon]|jgi:small subunit ribosomal protein S4